MKKITFVILLTIVLMIGIAIVATRTTSTETEKDPDVAVTTFFLYDIVKHISGDAVEVVLIVPQQTDPRTFAPTAIDIARINDTRVIYRIGFGIDDWSTRIADAKTDVLTLSTDLALHKKGNTINPYYFLTIPNAKHMATMAAQDLGGHFPKYRAVFQANLATYLAQLDNADEEIRSILATSLARTLQEAHELEYFAVEYGFTFTYASSYAWTEPILENAAPSYIDLMKDIAHLIARK